MNKKNLNNKKIKFITCEVVLDEIKDRIPASWQIKSFEKRLHERSDELRANLQNEINLSQDYDLIILGYGLCGKSVEGLVSEKTLMVIPKCDDCISLLLGSADEYRKQIKNVPGTYYLTRGYIGESENPMLSNYDQMIEKYGEDTLKWILSEMLKNYSRLVFINTGNYEPKTWREIAISQANNLGLKFEEIKGTDEYFKMLLNCDWKNSHFLIIKPGQKVKFEMFLP